jgi:hypothetical protein
VRCVRTTGGIGVVGVYVPQDPKAPGEGAKDGRIGFDFGTLFQKGQRIGTGQCPVKRYNETLRDLIIVFQDDRRLSMPGRDAPPREASSVPGAGGARDDERGG